MLGLDPLHVSPELHTANPAGVRSHETDTVESADDTDDENKEPLQHFHKLLWLRWMMSEQADFRGEMNMLVRLANDRGCKVWFLPKFHCELNTAELYWCNSKAFVRRKVDGKWNTMVKALWWSYGPSNLSLVTMRRFSRKIREIVHLYQFDVSGPFAIYCQKK